MTIQNNPSLYVGTYKKYNAGSIAGAWLNLTDYSDSEAFYDACRELHDGENDPEFMFQDYENIPNSLYSESGNIDAIYDYIDAVNASNLDQEVFDAGLSLGIPLESIEDAYVGSYDNDQDFAYEMADSVGMINNGLTWPYTCIDWERAARDLMFDYIKYDHHYFLQIY